MRILRADQHKRMPWKNGGGETTEIAVFPEDAGLSDFDWRVSMARVDGDGPFSMFPGIDRTLSILDGAGIVLDVGGHEPRRLTPESDPYAFPADVPTSARLIGGTVTDLNVMSRRGRIRHRVRSLGAPMPTDASFARLLFCADGLLPAVIGDEHIVLGRHDALLLDSGEVASATPGNGGRGFLVTLQADFCSHQGA